MGLFGFGKKKPAEDKGFQYYCMSLDFPERKKEYLEKSAALGSKHGQAALARYYLDHGPQTTENYRKVADLFEKAMVQGALLPWEKLAYTYSKLDEPEMAVKYYERAAKEGSASAQYAMGYACHVGKGTKTDLQQAAMWYEMAAQQGDASAMNNLASLYVQGEGVEKNREKASELYEKAASLGSAAAMGNMAFRYWQGDQGIPQDYKKALEFAQKGMEKKNKRSQWVLAMLYKDGCGVEQDLLKAAALLEDLVRQGDQTAKEPLQEVKKEMLSLREELYKAGKKACSLEKMTRSAELGSPQACAELATDAALGGFFYNNGKRLGNQELLRRFLYSVVAEKNGLIVGRIRETLMDQLAKRAKEEYTVDRFEEAKELVEPLIPYEHRAAMVVLGMVYHKLGKERESRELLEKAEKAGAAQEQPVPQAKESPAGKKEEGAPEKEEEKKPEQETSAEETSEKDASAEEKPKETLEEDTAAESSEK